MRSCMSYDDCRPGAQLELPHGRSDGGGEASVLGCCPGLPNTPQGTFASYAPTYVHCPCCPHTEPVAKEWRPLENPMCTTPFPNLSRHKMAAVVLGIPEQVINFVPAQCWLIVFSNACSVCVRAFQVSLCPVTWRENEMRYTIVYIGWCHCV